MKKQSEQIDRKHSLQPQTGVPPPNLRHTKSQNYGSKPKTVTVSTIAEVEKEVPNRIVNETSRKPKPSKSSHRNNPGIDNGAFELDDYPKTPRGNSVGNSLRSSTRSSSTISLEVVREQYCCYAKWSPCERTLFAAVCVLAFIVIVLMIVVVLVAVPSSDDDSHEKSILNIFDN